METLLGGLLGGVFRLMPELLKWLDRKNERAHEAAMFDKQLEADKVRSAQRQEEIRTQGQVTLDAAGLEALKEAIKGQAQASGVKWVDALNALMRPIITCQWVVFLYPLTLVAQAYLLHKTGVPAAAAIVQTFGPQEKAICAGIINFWFLDRVIRKQSA